MSTFRNRLSAVLLFTLMALAACTDSNEQQEGNTSSDIIISIKSQARFYSTECKIHKIISYSDVKEFQGNILNQKFSIDLPLGKRSLAIPVEATVKTFVDFSDFNEDNVVRKGDRIEIILPDPKIEVTSTKINHDDVKLYVPFLRANFTDEELTRLELRGREQIVKDLQHLNLTEAAETNTARVLIPLLQQAGFDINHITITFRKHFSPADIPTLLFERTTPKD